MNRTYLKWGIGVALLGALAYLGWGFTSKLNHKKAIAQRTQMLPPVSVETLGGQRVVVAGQGQPTVLLFIEPDCDHCQREAAELYQQHDKLAGAAVFVLSAAPFSELKTFAQTYRLLGLSNVQVAHIERSVAHDTFGFATTPDVLIYHADGSLSKRFKGETSIEAIRRHL
jgi:thiol-disulfide isomerase/thioredoxin